MCFTRTIFAGIVFVISSTVLAVAMPPVPTEPIYFEPPVVTANQQQKQLNCVELDQAIRGLHPYRYSYKPAFYEDTTNVVATTFVFADPIPLVGSLLGLGYLTYSSLVDEKEKRRQLTVEQQISMLQGLKAEQHCFE